MLSARHSSGSAYLACKSLTVRLASLTFFFKKFLFQVTIIIAPALPRLRYEPGYVSRMTTCVPRGHLTAF